MVSYIARRQIIEGMRLPWGGIELLNEQAWLTCDDPYAVLDHLRSDGERPENFDWRPSRPTGGRSHPSLAPRGRLDRYTPLSDELLELAEALAEGRVSYDEAERGHLGVLTGS